MVKGEGATEGSFKAGMCRYFSSQASSLVQSEGMMSFLFRFATLGQTYVESRERIGCLLLLLL
jgi:hypothetical protein